MSEEQRLLELFDGVGDGRYAARLLEDDFVFFRFVLRKHGQYKGSRMIQVQSSDSWLLAGYVNRMGLNRFLTLEKRLDHFKMVLCAPDECAYLYSEKLGVCCKCGKTLTDERSRALKIGPECEKKNPEFLAYALSRLPDGPHSWERQSESSVPSLRITIPTSTLARPRHQLRRLS